MSLMVLLILKTYLIGTFSIVLIAMMGRILVPLRHLNLRWPALVFLQFSIALLMIVFAFSVWITRGVTSNIIIAAFLLIYLVSNRKHIRSLNFTAELIPL